MTAEQFMTVYGSAQVELIRSVPMVTPAMIPLPGADPPVDFVRTAEEFLEHYGDGYEVIDGLAVEMPMPGGEHGFICGLVSHYLIQHVLAAGCGRVLTADTTILIRKNPLTLYGPDAAYYSFERLPRGPVLKGLIEAKPEFVVEVRSPSDPWGDLAGQAGEYLAAGVTAVVVLDPDTRSAAVYRAGLTQQALGPDTQLTLPDVLPGFAVAGGEVVRVTRHKEPPCRPPPPRRRSGPPRPFWNITAI